MTPWRAGTATSTMAEPKTSVRGTTRDQSHTLGLPRARVPVPVAESLQTGQLHQHWGPLARQPLSPHPQSLACRGPLDDSPEGQRALGAGA